jgi:SNF2 family DNA or RNA helicase
MSWRVLEKERVLIADLHFPKAVLNGIKYREAVVKGCPVTLFQHDYQTWRALRSIGLLAPSPLYQYSWPGRFKPMHHQLETVEHLILYDKAFCLDPIGSGKTNAAIWAGDYLQSIGEIRRILVIAPLSIVDHVWARELFKTLPHRRAVVLKGSRDRKQALAKDTDYSWIIVNPDSLHIIVNHLPQVDLVVVDEFTFFKTRSTRRYKALAKLKDRKLWLMSGTPAPQAPTDAYAPIRLVNPKSISFMAFRDLTMIRVSQFRWVPRPEAEKVIAQWMQPAIRHRREECYDLPDVQVEPLKIDLTAQQEKLIDAFLRHAMAELDGKPITAANAAAVFSKVLQVMAGGVYETEADGVRTVHMVDAKPYYETVERVVAQADTPVLIFTSFRSCVIATVNHLKKRGYRVESVLGGDTGRAAVFDRFLNGELDALVAVSSTMSHGLTLTNCRVVVWASPPTSFETYNQANGRVIRKGQKNNVIIFHMVRNSIDKRLFSRLKSKERLQDAVLELLTERRKNGESKQTTSSGMDFPPGKD